MVQQAKTGNPAIRLGLLYGVGLGVLLLLNALLNLAVGQIPGIVSLIVLLIALAAYFVTGFQASAVTGKVSTGLVAGLITGIVSSLVNLAGYIILVFVFYDKIVATYEQALQTAGRSGQVQITQGFVLAASIGSLIFGLVIAAIVGLALGALGGVVGKSRAPVPTEAYNESFYQGLGGAPRQPGAYPPPPPAYPPQEGNWPQNPPTPGQ